MKRVGYLFERVIEPENLRLAFFKASRGKRHREDQRVWQSNLENEIARLRDGLMNLDYPIGNYRRFTIYEPKEREICAASFGERVLHHALMNVCQPYFDKWLIHDSYACRIGNGQKAALARARQFAHRYKWFLKCDFRKYFDSIPHDKLKSMLARRFKDPMILAWFGRIIDSYEKKPDRGLPIGNLTSQHLANLYLDRLDRLVNGAYVRYMDDFIFWADNKNEPVSLREQVVAFARDELGLELKQTPFVNRTSFGMDLQHRRTDICAVPANGLFPLSCGTNYEGCRDVSSSVESCAATVLRTGGIACK